jgi:hypothetical protein
MIFQKYERGDWKTETVGMQISSRPHSLYFICEKDELTPERFAVASTVNQDEFLEVGSELLLCVGVFVDHAAATADLTEYAELVEAAKVRYWRLRYDFSEHAAQKWNEFYFPADGGKLMRRREELIPLTDMAAFFGANAFPVDVPQKEKPVSGEPTGQDQGDQD